MKNLTTFIFIFLTQFFYGQWVPQVSGTTQNLNDVYAITENLVFAVGNNGTILKTTNGGLNWILKTSGTTQPLTKIQFANENSGYAIGFNGILLKTTNGGDTWIQISANITGNIYGLNVIDSNTFFISGSSGVIKKTIDGGASFTSLNVPENKIVSNLQFFGDLIGFAQVGDFDLSNTYPQSTNKLYKTTNGGLNWIIINQPIDSFYFVNQNLGFVSKSNEAKLYKTINGGLIFINTGFSNFYGKDLFSVDGNFVWEIGNNPTLCFCDDFCINKKEIIDFTVTQAIRACRNVYYFGDRFNAIFFKNNAVGFVVGLSGVIQKNVTGINALNLEGFEKNKLFKIYPNPASELINLTFESNQSQSYKVEIYSSLGKKILSNEYPTINNLQIETKSFSKGLYIVNISIGNIQQTQKLIIN